MFKAVKSIVPSFAKNFPKATTTKPVLLENLNAYSGSSRLDNSDQTSKAEKSKSSTSPPTTKEIRNIQSPETINYDIKLENSTLDANDNLSFHKKKINVSTEIPGKKFSVDEKPKDPIIAITSTSDEKTIKFAEIRKLILQPEQPKHVEQLSAEFKAAAAIQIDRVTAGTSKKFNLDKEAKAKAKTKLTIDIKTTFPNDKNPDKGDKEAIIKKTASPESNPIIDTHIDKLGADILKSSQEINEVKGIPQKNPQPSYTFQSDKSNIADIPPSVNNQPSTGKKKGGKKKETKKLKACSENQGTLAVKETLKKPRKLKKTKADSAPAPAKDKQVSSVNNSDASNMKSKPIRRKKGPSSKSKVGDAKRIDQLALDTLETVVPLNKAEKVPEINSQIKKGLKDEKLKTVDSSSKTEKFDSEEPKSNIGDHLDQYITSILQAAQEKTPTNDISDNENQDMLDTMKNKLDIVDVPAKAQTQPPVKKKTGGKKKEAKEFKRDSQELEKLAAAEAPKKVRKAKKTKVGSVGDDKITPIDDSNVPKNPGQPNRRKKRSSLKPELDSTKGFDPFSVNTSEIAMLLNNAQESLEFDSQVSKYLWSNTSEKLDDPFGAETIVPAELNPGIVDQSSKGKTITPAKSKSKPETLTVSASLAILKSSQETQKAQKKSSANSKIKSKLDTITPKTTHQLLKSKTALSVDPKLRIGKLFDVVAAEILKDSKENKETREKSNNDIQANLQLCTEKSIAADKPSKADKRSLKKGKKSTHS